jgi:hypothetical protein
MLIGGVDTSKLPVEVFLVLPRGDKEIVFRAEPVSDMDPFEVLCPRPLPPGKMTREGYVTEENDPGYNQMLINWGLQRMGYMVMKSLKPSNIVWDTVNENDPASWKNWSKDLKEAGLGDNERQRVLNLVLEANCLDENKLKKAREVFLLGQGTKPASIGLHTEPQTTPSGVPANG